MKAAVLLLAAIAASAVPFAFAQTEPTPAMLQECSDLGISADNCTEQAILTKRHIITRDNQSTEVKMDPVLFPIYAGIAVAFVAGVLYVRRTKDSRKARQSH